MQATPSLQVDNERVIVTRWTFAPGAETGDQAINLVLDDR